MGLKDNSDPLPPSPTREAKRGGSSLSTPSLPAPKSQHSTPGQQAAQAGLPSAAKPPPEGAASPAKASQASQLGAAEEEEEEDWLGHALARKKSRGLAREERTKASEGQNSMGAAGQPPSDRYGLGLLSGGGRFGQGRGGPTLPLSWLQLGALAGSLLLAVFSPSLGTTERASGSPPRPRCRHEGLRGSSHSYPGYHGDRCSLDQAGDRGCSNVTNAQPSSCLQAEALLPMVPLVQKKTKNSLQTVLLLAQTSVSGTHVG